MNNLPPDVADPEPWMGFAQVLLDTMAVPAAVLEIDGRLRLVNPPLCKSFGRSARELLGLKPGRHAPGVFGDSRFIAGLSASAHADVRPFQAGRGPPPASAEWCVRLRHLPPMTGSPRLVVASFDRLSSDDAPEVVHEQTRWQARAHSLAVALTLSGEHERRSLAVSLHDGPIQELVLLLRTLRSLAEKSTPAMRPEAEACIARAIRTLHETRSVKRQLSPTTLYDLGLVPALASLVESFRTDYALAVELIALSAPSIISRPVEIICFRTVRELLLNCVKHAPSAEVVVTVRRCDEGVRVVVHDAGPGFDFKLPPRDGAAPGFGLSSISAQALGIGGAFTFEAAPGEGCRAELTLPISYPTLSGPALPSPTAPC